MSKMRIVFLGRVHSWTESFILQYFVTPKTSIFPQYIQTKPASRYLEETKNIFIKL